MEEEVEHSFDLSPHHAYSVFPGGNGFEGLTDRRAASFLTFGDRPMRVIHVCTIDYIVAIKRGSFKQDRSWETLACTRLRRCLKPQQIAEMDPSHLVSPISQIWNRWPTRVSAPETAAQDIFIEGRAIGGK